MEKMNDPWREITRIIERDKKAGLAYLNSREFTPAAPASPPSGRPLRLPAPRPAWWLAAASVFMACGLVFLWLLRARWSSAPAAPPGSEILSASLLYATAGSGESARPGVGSAGPVSPQFAAWADALERSTTVTDGSVPAIPAGAEVDRGDPEELRRRLGRAIRTGAFERQLSHWQEFHEKEA